jgi:hypothetical protein
LSVDLSDFFKSSQADIETEQAVSGKILDRLSLFFDIETEVSGRHFSGKDVRIDAMLTPKDWLGWKAKSPIGLEIKRGHQSIGEVTKQISQAVDYANSHFPGFGYVYVFCYPDPEKSEWGQFRCFYDRLAGQLGVGFLGDLDNGLRLTLKGHLVWSESTGPYEAKRWSMKRRFGSK